MPPSRAAIVLSSSRSIAVPDVFVTTIASSTRNARVPKLNRTVAEYSAETFMLVALTDPGRIASTDGGVLGPLDGADATGEAAAADASDVGVAEPESSVA